MKITRSQLLQHDWYSWVVDKYVLPSGDKYTLTDYDYLVDIFKRKWKPWDNLFVQKSSQCGASEAAISCLLWMNERLLPNWHGSGYIMPARKQLESHVKSRVIPILEHDNFRRNIRGMNLSLLQYGSKKYPVNFRSGQTRRELISFPADFIVIDEFDEFYNPISVIPTLRARFNASDYGWIFGLSTPTYPGLGIDAAITRCNQFNWYVDCDKCKKKFSPLNEVLAAGFENCVVQAPLTRTYGFVCPNCHDLTNTCGAKGGWQQDVEMDSQNYGYRISRLFLKRASLKELFLKWSEALNLQEFYNSDLGLPYAPANARLSRNEIERACIGPENMASGSANGTWLGVDVGRKCHWVVGKMVERNGKNAHEIIAYGTNSFEEMDNIEERFNVKCAVYDLRPYEQEVKKKIRGKKKWFACDFNTGKDVEWYKIVRIDEGTSEKSVKIIKAARTECCDTLINQFVNKQSIILPSSAKNDNALIGQLTTPMRMDESDPKTGEVKSFYGSAKADHYFFAMVYLLLAFQMKKQSVAWLGPKLWGQNADNR